MPKIIKKCEICGKEYEYCHTLFVGSNAFRWQEVACSPECGKIFFDKVMAVRKADAEAQAKAETDAQSKHSDT